MIYHAYQAHASMASPMRLLAAEVRAALGRSKVNGWQSLRSVDAACQVIQCARLTHRRLPFGIESVPVEGRELRVLEEVVAVTPFGTLLRFRKEGAPAQPRVLLV